jgi:hypothetical protein
LSNFASENQQEEYQYYLLQGERWSIHGLASSYLEVCNFLSATISSPANSLARSLNYYGPETQGDFTH